MTRLTLNGSPLYAEGTLPAVGQDAPRFTLATEQLGDVGLDQFDAPCVVLNLVPSLALPSFERATRRLAAALRALPEVQLLTISSDLPFGAPRQQELSGCGRYSPVLLSNFRSPKFARSYGVELVTGPLKGLMAPAVLVLDAQRRVRHVELLRELNGQPDLPALVEAARAAGGLRTVLRRTSDRLMGTPAQTSPMALAA